MKFYLLILSVLLIGACAKNNKNTTSSTHQNHTLDTTDNSPIGKLLASMHEDMLNSEFAQSANLDWNFIKNMIPHHLGAIKSSKILLTSTSNSELITLASNIIATQEKEVSEFTTLLTELKTNTVTYTEEQISNFNTMASDNMSQMMTKMMRVSTNSIEKAYIEAMIAHHEGAVKDAQDIAAISKNEKIQNIAATIIADQEKEIVLMNTLLSNI
ncbi:MAG: DUF305 domain-containing protein [Brevinema sp.]